MGREVQREELGVGEAAVGLLPWLMFAWLYPHQGLSGKLGPRGERGPTVSAVGRHPLPNGSRSQRWAGQVAQWVATARAHKAMGSNPSTASAERGCRIR